MLDLKRIEVPDSEWVERLRPGHWIYLVKEGHFARIAHSYEASNGNQCGQIFIHKFPNNCFTGTEQWYVRSDGRGLDGNLLIAPVEGNVTDKPLPYTGTEVQKLERRLYELTTRIQRLERMLLERLGLYGD